MTVESLSYISDLMDELNIPYAFSRWVGDLPEIFFVGEYNEVLTMNKEETGQQETTFILRGYTRGSWLLLEQAKATIESAVQKTDILPNGNGIVIMYNNGYIVPVPDGEMKSIQINLTIQEWKVN